MSSKSRRRVTVEGNDGEKRKPSVFERLGPGAPPRSSSGHEEDKCRHWIKYGQCRFGSACKFKHPGRARSPDDLRHRVPRKRDEDSLSESETEKTKEQSPRKSRKDKESKIKSTVVVTKPSLQDSDGPDSDAIDPANLDELDFDTTLKLIKKRQALQKQLSLLEYEEQENEQESFTRSRSDDEPERPSVVPPQPLKHKKIAKVEESSPPKKKSKDKKKKKKKSLPDSPELEPETKKRPIEKASVAPPPPPMPVKSAKPKSAERKPKRSKSTSSRSSSRSESRSPVRQKSPMGRKREKRKRSAEKSAAPYDSAPSHGKKLSPGTDRRGTSKKTHSPPPEPAPRKESWHSPERRKLEKPSPRDSRSRKVSPVPPPTSHGVYDESRRMKRSNSPPRPRGSRASPSGRSRQRTSGSKKIPSGGKPGKRHSETSESSSTSESSDSSSSSDESVRRRTSTQRDRRSDRGESYKQESRDTRESRFRDTESHNRKRGRDSDDRSTSTRRGKSPEESTRESDRSKSKRRLSADRSPVKRRAPSPSHRSRHEQSPMEVSSSASPGRVHDKSRSRTLAREPDRSDSRSRDDRRSERGDRGEREIRREESPRTRAREEPSSPSRSGRERERLHREEYETDRSRKLERTPEPPKRGSTPSQEQLRSHPREQRDQRDQRDLRGVSPGERHRRDYREEYYSRDARDPREARDPRALDERHLDPRYLESIRYSEQFRDREGRPDPRLLPEYRDPYADPRRERYDAHALPPDPRYDRDPRYDPRDPRYERDPRYAERALLSGRELDRREELRLREYRHSDLARLPPEDLRALERRGYPPHPDVYAELSRSDRTSRRQQWEEFERRRAMYDRKDPRYDERLERDPRDLRDPRDPHALERWDPREEELAREGRREWQRDQEERERAKKDMPSFGLAAKYSRSGGPPKTEPKPQKGKRPLPKDGASEEGDRKRLRGEQSRERGRDGKRRGEAGFSDWSEEDREQAALAAEGDDRSRRGEECRQEEAPEVRERDRRSPSRSSLGSRMSHRERDGERYDERRRGERERDREKRDEEKGEEKERSERGARDEERLKKPEEKEDNNFSRSGRSDSERDRDKEEKRHSSDHMSEAGSGRGPRKDSLRSIDSFSSFDQIGAQAAVTLEPAPENPQASAPADSIQDKAKEPEATGTGNSSDTKADQAEQPEENGQGESGDGQAGDLKDAYDDISDDDIGEFIDNSDDKVDSQEPKKTGIVDSLQIDWASLAKDTSSKEHVQGSALKRFTVSNILSQIGISKAYAGEKLTNELINHCQRQLEEEAAEENNFQGENGTDQPVKPAPKFVLHSDIASFHSCIRSRMEERANLLKNIGPYRRALCARRDLYIRRKLCKLDGEHDLGDFTDQVVDHDLYKQSIQLLKGEKTSLEEKTTTEN